MSLCEMEHWLGASRFQGISAGPLLLPFTVLVLNFQNSLEICCLALVFLFLSLWVFRTYLKIHSLHFLSALNVAAQLLIGLPISGLFLYLAFFLILYGVFENPKGIFHTLLFFRVYTVIILGGSPFSCALGITHGG